MVLTGRAAAIAFVAVLPIAVAPWPAMVFLTLSAGLALAILTDVALAQDPGSLILTRGGSPAARLGEPVETVLGMRNGEAGGSGAACATRGRPVRWPSPAAIR